MSQIDCTTTRRCGKCQQVLPVSAFSKFAQSKDGLQSYCKACSAAYYAAHREERSAYDAAYHAAHREEERARDAAYYAAHREAARAKNRNRRARKRNAPGSHTAAQVKELLQKQKGKCVYCKSNIRKGYHADHVIALANGGSNDIKNIQLTCPTCNHSKNAKDNIEFAQQRGFLL